MRVQYIKAVVEAEMNLEQLTPKEKVDFLLEMIGDINGQCPDYKFQLIKRTENDNALDW